MYPRPTWILTNPQANVEPWARYTKTVANRTGGALVVGTAYQLDTGKTLVAAETTYGTKNTTQKWPAVSNYKWDDPASAFNNLIAVETGATAPTAGTPVGNAPLQVGIIGIAEAATARNDLTDILLVGATSALTGPITSGGIYGPWCQLELGVGQMFLRSNGSSTARRVGVNLASVSFSSTTAQIISVVFNGIPSFG